VTGVYEQRGERRPDHARSNDSDTHRILLGSPHQKIIVSAQSNATVPTHSARCDQSRDGPEYSKNVSQARSVRCKIRPLVRIEDDKHVHRTAGGIEP